MLRGRSCDRRKVRASTMERRRRGLRLDVVSATVWSPPRERAPSVEVESLAAESKMSEKDSGRRRFIRVFL